MSNLDDERIVAAPAEESSLTRPSLGDQLDFARELDRILRPYEPPAASEYRCY